ncbi:MAG: glycosyltransferase family 4 protein [Ignavibacteria bacterium]|nr:glycosyltransferase family 4 protein [Ignavibacteria bacterium]
MKYLIISNMYPSEEQPEFAPFMKNIENGLRKNGVEVDKIVIVGRGDSIISKIKKYLSLYIMIIKCDFSKYDFIQVSYPSHSYFPLIFKSPKGAKLIVRLHGEDLLNNNGKESLFLKIGRLIFTRLSILRSDVVVVPSFYFLHVLKNKYHPLNVYVYPSGGIDTSKFFPKEIVHHKFTIGFVGRLVEGKGVEVLLKALKLLHFKYKVVIVGAGPLEKQLKEQTYKLDLYNSVEFVGSIKNELLVNYYNLFDIFVFPTFGESFGNVGLEAMACKVPVIGSEIEALKDYLVEGFNGYYFEVGNFMMLANKIEKYYSISDDEKILMKNNSYQTALAYESFSLTKKYVDYLNINFNY